MSLFSSKPKGEKSLTYVQQIEEHIFQLSSTQTLGEIASVALHKRNKIGSCISTLNIYNLSFLWMEADFYIFIFKLA